ncbi:hypothetical protein SXCC_00404 [Gluconacetobacter sp. SXCC-1]|nr:hypothetical protein SXCC_00404 [Gluconacetobacter sp. SXCC-1]
MFPSWSLTYYYVPEFCNPDYDEIGLSAASPLIPAPGQFCRPGSLFPGCRPCRAYPFSVTRRYSGRQPSGMLATGHAAVERP